MIEVDLAQHNRAKELAPVTLPWLVLKIRGPIKTKFTFRFIYQLRAISQTEGPRPKRLEQKVGA